MSDADKIKVVVLTEAEFLEARTRSCAEVGLTWDELMAKRRPCGCCFDGPDIYRRIWFAYDTGAARG